MSTAALDPANPFATPSDLPHGLPPFGAIRREHLRPALLAGMTEQLAEVAAVTGDPAPATFENTVVALERSGALLHRAEVVLNTWSSSDADAAVQELDGEMAPLLAAHRDTIALDPVLFARIEQVHAGADALDADAAHLVRKYHRDAVRAGAGLDAATTEALRAVNRELSGLSTRFQHRLLADTNGAAVLVDDPDRLAGLADGARDAAAASAADRGHPGGYALTLVLPTRQPALASLTDRALRQQLHEASVRRGLRGDENDTTDTLRRIVELRARRAQLLGFPDHATYVLADRAAGTPEAVAAMLDQVTEPAVALAETERAELQAVLGAEPLRAWDWTYATEQLRRERFDVDAEALRPYFELERVLRDGVFHAAEQLFGLTVTERPDLVGYHPDVRVFAVADADGADLGLFLGDYYARPAKRGGAWMHALVDQSSLLGTRPVVVNNLNLVRPALGGPTLLSLDEVTTAFHEFGHALHGLLSAVRYPAQAGTSVQRDVVEYPSQVNEMWATWPEILPRYARHHRTGEPLPAELLDRLLAAQQWGEGFRTVEYLAATVLDLAYHRLGPDDEVGDVEAFEARALADAGLDVAEIPPRYRSSYFAHIFSGGYSAGYYSYLWSEVLDADSVDWFRENGGLTRANGDHFRATVLSRGGSRAELTSYQEFRGRAPRVEPLLDRRGLRPTG